LRIVVAPRLLPALAWSPTPAAALVATALW
jgi:hypothetical protein